MRPSLTPLSALPTSRPLAPYDEAALLNAARLLQAAALRGEPARQLKGKNVGLLCCEAEEAGGEAQRVAREGRALFLRAAGELGAQVATIPPALSKLGNAAELAQTARILGRFYDAVECQGFAPEAVRQIAQHAGIPVYDGAACDSHPTAALAARLDDRTSAADNRRFVLQALLVLGSAG